jgi:hypothetical protein
MTAKNWTLKMKLRVSQLIVKMMGLITIKACAGKDIPGRKLRLLDLLCAPLNRVLPIVCNPYRLVTSHSHLSIVGVQQVAMNSALDDASPHQDAITSMAARTNHLVQQSVVK